MITLNDTTVKALPAPVRGNKIYYFAGALLQGIAARRALDETGPVHTLRYWKAPVA